MKWDQNNPEKVKDFIAKMKQDYAFKKAYAARRAWEFYNHPDVAGMCYVAVGGLDSITLFLFLRSIGIDVPGTSVSMLEDRSIQKVHKALGIRALRPANGPKDRPYTKIEVIKEHGFPVLSKEIAGKISLLQHPSEKNATVRHAIMTGETGAYGGYRKNTRMKMSQKWLEKFGGPENEKYGTNYQTAPFKVSDLCCYYLKEKPCNDYARSSRRFPYMGLMASEGGRRQKALMLNGCNYIENQTGRRNKRDVWTVSTNGFRGAHFAVFPEKLIEPCILAGSPLGGTVLDPFAGSGTTGVVAKRLRRDFIGCEINPDYAQMAADRIAAPRRKEGTVEVTVNMTAEEFLEFVAWRKEQDYYKSRLDKELNEREILAKKTCWAIDTDPKKPGKVKIIDQEHAAELLEMAKDYLA